MLHRAPLCRMLQHQYYQGRRKDFWSGPAVIGARIWNAVCNGARANIYNEFHKIAEKAVRQKPDQADRLLRLLTESHTFHCPHGGICASHIPARIRRNKNSRVGELPSGGTPEWGNSLVRELPSAGTPEWGNSRVGELPGGGTPGWGNSTVGDGE